MFLAEIKKSINEIHMEGGAWVVQSVECPTLGFISHCSLTDVRLWDGASSGFQAQWGVLLSLSICPSPARVCMVSLSLK